MDQQGIDYVFDKVMNMWRTQYFHGAVLVFFCVSFISMLVYNRRFDKLWVRVSLLLFMGVLFYAALQFYTFGDHDYYTINLNILPVIITLGLADYTGKNHPKWMKGRNLRIVFFIFLAMSLIHARAKVHERYYGWWSEYEFKKDLHEITPYLRSIGIKPDDRVISIPDQSHLTLYLMNQKGWTEYTDMRLHEENAYHYNNNTESIKYCIDNGAKYLVVNGIQELIKRPHFMTYATNLVGKYNNVLIFDLNNREKNFTLKDKVIKERVFINVEDYKNQQEKYRSNNRIFIQDYHLQITEKPAYSGNHAWFYCNYQQSAVWGKF
jgi:hypothetical protein